MFDKMQQMTPETEKLVMSIVKPMMEMNFNSRDKMLKDLNGVVEPGGIVFTGDSITEGYPIHELMPHVSSLRNRGVSGITSAQLLERIDDYVIKLAPDKVVLLVGINDLNNGEEPGDIAERVYRICLTIRHACPNTKLYVQSVYPIDSSRPIFAYSAAQRSNDDIINLNRMIENQVKAISGTTYIDLYSALCDSQGKLNSEYTTEGLHISIKGYQKITEVLLPYIE